MVPAEFVDYFKPIVGKQCCAKPTGDGRWRTAVKGGSLPDSRKTAEQAPLRRLVLFKVKSKGATRSVYYGLLAGSGSFL
jgi:hypothetical protein